MKYEFGRTEVTRGELKTLSTEIVSIYEPSKLYDLMNEKETCASEGHRALEKFDISLFRSPIPPFPHLLTPSLSLLLCDTNSN